MALLGFDLKYYINKYPDVALASSILGGLSPEQHFLQYGVREGRNPNANFDTTYYAQNNPDVAEAVRAGLVANVYEHYIQYGGKEGRAPSAALAGAKFDAAAYLAANADVKDAGYDATTALSHYVLYGAAEGRANPSAPTGGQDYTLTTGQDVLTGTSANDTFRAVAGLSTGAQDQTTLNSSDILDGGAGNDLLVVNLTGPNYRGGATIKNIETLKVGTNLTTGAIFDYNVNAGVYEISGVKDVTFDQINDLETLTVQNIVRDNGTGDLPALSWVNDSTAINGKAGVVNVAYRAAAVSASADAQTVNLTNVRGGTLNVAAGIEKITLNSLGTATNSIALIDSASGGTTTLTEVVINATAQLGGARKTSTDANTRGLEIFKNPLNTNIEDTSFVQVGNRVTKVDASASTAAVHVQFTDATAINNTFLGGAGNDQVILNGGNDSVSGGAGNDTFIFNQTNTSSNGIFFNNSDTIDGGEGTDTLLINYAKDAAGTLAQVTIQTSEWLNSKGLDALDIRALNSRVQLDDAFVSRSDANTFEVITDKIVQSDATNSVADEASSRHLIDLTTVSAARAIKVTGGEGRETVIVSDALNGNSTLSGGRGLDTLVVQNGATLTGQDLQNVSGFNVINLVKTSAGAQVYNIDLTAAFLTAAVDNNVAAGVSKNSLNAFRILTDAQYSGSTGTSGRQNISGVQMIGQNDTVNITIDTTSAGVTGIGAVNVNDLLASNAIIVIRDTAGQILLRLNADANGNYSGGAFAASGIFAGAVATENGNYTDIVANPVVGAGTPLASGQASSGGTGIDVGNSFVLTGANVILNNTTANFGTDKFGTSTVLGAGNDTITAGTLLNNGNYNIQDGSNTDADVLNATIVAGAVPATFVVAGIETLNLTSFGGNLALGTVTGTPKINVHGAGATFTAVEGKTLTVGGSTFTGTLIANVTTAATDDFTVALTGNTTPFSVSTNAVDGITLNATGAATIGTLTTAGAGIVQVTGSGNLTITDNLVGAQQVNASAYTGNLSVKAGAAASTITGGSGSDTILGGAGADVLVGGAGNDSIVANDGNDTITGGAGADTIVAGAGNDQIRIALTDIAAGTIKANADTIIGFDFANDLIDIDGILISAGAAQTAIFGVYGTDQIAAAQYLSEATGATALNNANKNGVAVLELTTAVTGDFTTQAGIDAAVAALVAAYTANAVANTKIIIALYDTQAVANAALFLYDEGAADGGISASELSLIGVLNGVGAGNLTEANFA